MTTIKHYIILHLIALMPILSIGQSSEAAGRFGVALNSSLNGELQTMRLVPSAVYTKGKHQFELGMGFNPLGREDQKLLSAEMNYKYHPNRMDQKFNMYLILRLSYVNRINKTYYPTTYNYLFANGGYGFDIKASERVFIGTNMSIGAYTFHKKSEVPYSEFSNQDLFDEFGLTLAFQFNVRYSF